MKRNNEDEKGTGNRELLSCDQCPDIEFESEDELARHMIDVHNVRLVR